MIKIDIFIIYRNYKIDVAQIIYLVIILIS